MLEAKTDAAPALRWAECSIQAEDDSADWRPISAAASRESR
jgi:hypothetical protein